MAAQTDDDTVAARRGRQADTPVGIPLRGWRDIFMRLKDEIGRDHVTLTAAGVAFFGFTALVPLFGAAVAIYGLAADPSNVEQLVERVEGAAPSEVVEVIGQQLRAVTSASTGGLGLAAVVGIAVALWSASSGVGHLIEAINIAYDEEPDDRPFWKRRLLAIAFTIGAVSLLILVAALSTVASTATTNSSSAVQVGVWTIIGILMMIALAVLFRYGPNRSEPRWEWVTPGAVIAVVGWVLASVGLRFYVGRFGSYNETYGALGAVVVTLLWLYVSAFIIIMAAEINSEVEHQTTSDTTTGPPQPMGRRGAVKADTVGESP